MAAWLLLHFGIGLAGTWLARGYALHRELLDHPGERRSHDVPTPRGGGVSIVLALLVAACVLGWRYPREIVLLGGFAIGLMLVAGVGMVDDHRPASPWLRLAVQAVASAVLAMAVAGTWGNLPLALFAFAAAMALTNVWNFMDGINGIAASQALLLAAGTAMAIGGAWAWMALALAAACAGFLPFNFPRARVFLGDVGSGALGFALATLLVVALAAGPLPVPLIFLPFAAFLVDSGLTLLRRVLRRETWWQPHAQHAYQRWAARAGNHTVVTTVYAAWTIAGWLLAWSLAPRADAARLTGCALWLAATVIVWAGLQYFTVVRQVSKSVLKDRE